MGSAGWCKTEEMHLRDKIGIGYNCPNMDGKDLSESRENQNEWLCNNQLRWKCQNSTLLPAR